MSSIVLRTYSISTDAAVIADEWAKQRNASRFISRAIIDLQRGFHDVSLTQPGDRRRLPRGDPNAPWYEFVHGEGWTRADSIQRLQSNDD